MSISQPLTPLDKKQMILGALIFLAFLGTWPISFLKIGTDIYQGDVYRILYIHVPFAFACFLCSLLLFIFSLLVLKNKQSPIIPYCRSTAELGLFFTCLTLLTGSIWGKATWGTWWTWDARLTTTFILAILYGGYLTLWSSIDSAPLRLKSCAILGILIFLDVPIIYKSVTWWRTLHQPPSLMAGGGPTMSPEIVNHLLLCAVITLIFCGWLIWQRGMNLSLNEKLENLMNH